MADATDVFLYVKRMNLLCALYASSNFMIFQIASLQSILTVISIAICILLLLVIQLYVVFLFSICVGRSDFINLQYQKLEKGTRSQESPQSIHYSHCLEQNMLKCLLLDCLIKKHEYNQYEGTKSV